MNTLISWNLQLQLKSITLCFDIVRLIFFFHVQCLLLVLVLAAVPLLLLSSVVFFIFPIWFALLLKILRLSGVRSWWQQTEQDILEGLTPSNTFHLLLGDSEAFPGLMR